MHVPLKPEHEEFVARKIAAGRYQGPGEVVAEALTLLEEHDRFLEENVQEFRRQIKIGLDQLDRGQSRPLDEDTFRQVREQGMMRVKRTDPST